MSIERIKAIEIEKARLIAFIDKTKKLEKKFDKIIKETTRIQNKIK